MAAKVNINYLEMMADMLLSMSLSAGLVSYPSTISIVTCIVTFHSFNVRHDPHWAFPLFRKDDFCSMFLYSVHARKYPGEFAEFTQDVGGHNLLDLYICIVSSAECRAGRSHCKVVGEL